MALATGALKPGSRWALLSKVGEEEEEVTEGVGEGEGADVVDDDAGPRRLRQPHVLAHIGQQQQAQPCIPTWP